MKFFVLFCPVLHVLVGMERSFILMLNRAFPNANSLFVIRLYSVLERVAELHGCYI